MFDYFIKSQKYSGQVSIPIEIGILLNMTYTFNLTHQLIQTLLVVN